MRYNEHSAWIRRLGFRVPLRSRHFLSQKLWHFHKNTRSCVENECCCPRTVNISNVNFISKISIPPGPVLKNMGQQMSGPDCSIGYSIRMNPKVGGSSPSLVETFSVSKIWHFHKNTRSCVENECCCPRTVIVSNVNFTSEIHPNSAQKVCLLHEIQCVANTCGLLY